MRKEGSWCRILLWDQSVVLQSARTQYVIRNLETHSMELDIPADCGAGQTFQDTQERSERYV